MAPHRIQRIQIVFIAIIDTQPELKNEPRTSLYPPELHIKISTEQPSFSNTSLIFTSFLEHVSAWLRHFLDLHRIGRRCAAAPGLDHAEAGPDHDLGPAADFFVAKRTSKAGSFGSGRRVSVACEFTLRHCGQNETKAERGTHRGEGESKTIMNFQRVNTPT